MNRGDKLALAGVAAISLAGLLLALRKRAVAQPATTLQASYQTSLPISSNSQQVALLEIALGGKEYIVGRAFQWYRLTGTKVSGNQYSLWFLADRNPFDPEKRAGILIARYILQEGSEQPVEYVARRTGLALLPLFRFVEELLPTGITIGDLFEVGTYLGLPITLTSTSEIEAIGPPADAITLVLDDEMLIASLKTTRPGTTENYTAAEYDEMISAGLNYFQVNKTQEEYVRKRAFYASNYAETLPFPECLYRSNFRGVAEYVDEPAQVQKIYYGYPTGTTLQQAVPILQDRVYRQALGLSYTGQLNAYDGLRTKLVGQGVDLGTLNLTPPDLPIWEFQVSTAWYQFECEPYLKSMVNMSIFLAADYLYPTQSINWHLGTKLPHTYEANALWEIAFLRGAARAFGGKWGVGIYAWVDLEFQKYLLKKAYDLGATYFWFWNHPWDSYIPYEEQLNLTRELVTHAEAHPRGDMSKLLHKAKTAIVLPYGYDLGWYGGPFGVFGLSPYVTVFQPACLEIQRCIEGGIPYDVVPAGAGFTGEGYATVIWVLEDGSIQIT